MPKVVQSIALVTSQAFSFANFRGPLIRSLVELGIRVYALAPDFDEDTRAAVHALGAEPIDISLERTGMGLKRDLSDIAQLVRTLRHLRPDLVLAYFIKPVIYGTIAATLARVPRRYALIPGLGYSFTPAGDSLNLSRRILRQAASSLYRLAFRFCDKVFLQNADDLELLCSQGILVRSKAVLTSGSGVDLDHFKPAHEIKSPLTFILVARLLREKGIVEYVEAARLIKREKPNVNFVLLGDFDPNPGGLHREDVQNWVAEGLVEWPGQVGDVRPWLGRSSVFVLPSYREGKPRSTQEAMAMGLPIITTEAPGCRDTVVEGANGFKVPVRDVQALAHAMRQFIADPALINKMGVKSRSMAEQMFDVRIINQFILHEMGLIPPQNDQADTDTAA